MRAPHRRAEEWASQVLLDLMIMAGLALPRESQLQNSIASAVIVESRH
jgi:hypothetical protein